MNNSINDKKYLKIVNDILKNEEFNKLKKMEHHGMSRFGHSLRVSYVAYNIAKRLGLNYEEVARAGLLHDFFLSKEDRNFKDKFISTFVHPKTAVENSIKIFNVNKKEIDIIRSHMFPFYFALPKYAESWVVIGVDKTLGSYEFIKKFGYKFTYITNLFILVLLKNLK